MTLSPLPGLADPDVRGRVMRVAGLVLLGLGVLAIGAALADLAGAFDRTVDVVDVAGLPGEVAVDDGPGLVWLLFAGIPLVLAGGLSLLQGYLRQPQPEAVRPEPGTCTSCGRRSAAGATFCESCGSRLPVLA